MPSREPKRGNAAAAAGAVLGGVVGLGLRADGRVRQGVHPHGKAEQAVLRHAKVVRARAIEHHDAVTARARRSATKT